MTDSADNIKTLLNNSWNSSNVPKPIIDLVETFKRIDLSGDQDVIVIYMTSGNVTPIGLGYGAEMRIQPVTIDIRTTKDKTRLLDLLSEVKRVIHANRRKSQNGIHDLIVYMQDTNLNNKTIKLWRYLVECETRDYSIPISG